MEKNNTPAAEFTLPPPAALPNLALDRTVTTDLAADLTLPDYLPEIRRLLRVTATPLPDSRYLGPASAEFGGVVEFLVCYAGGDGGLWSTRLRQDYRATTPIDPDLLAAGIAPTADPQLDAIVSRVTGPRKLNIRTRLRSRIRAWGEEEIEPTLEGDPAPAALERLTKPCRAMRILRAASEPIDLGADISFDHAEGEVRVIRADAAVHVSEAVAEQGGILCRGEMLLTLLTCTEHEAGSSLPEQTVRKLAFAERIPMEGAETGMAARAWGRCGDIAVTVEENRVLCDASLWLEGEAADEASLALTADLYATDGDVEDCTYREVEIERLARCGNLCLTQTLSQTLKEAGIDARAQILDVSATPQPTGITAADGRCTLEGSWRVSVIYLLDGEYAAAELSVPLQCTLDVGQILPSAWEAEAVTAGLRWRCDGEGEMRALSIEAELALAVRLYARESRRVLASAVYRPGEGRPQGLCTVCYPEPGDSVWSICRRYRISRGALMAANSLRAGVDCDLPASLEGVQYLLI
ncbi:MAG: LysM peptidoglycan-binding domain-containing protein [Clostridia bacterium]|nr:LysM peptidoglycan-binding domain-containing protein [Clostridia bacterium]